MSTIFIVYRHPADIRKAGANGRKSVFIGIDLDDAFDAGCILELAKFRSNLFFRTDDFPDSR